MLSKLSPALFRRFFQPRFINKHNFSSLPVGIIGAPFSKGQVRILIFLVNY